VLEVEFLLKLVQPRPPEPRQQAKASVSPKRTAPPRDRGITDVVAMVTTSTPQVRQQAGPTASHVRRAFAQKGRYADEDYNAEFAEVKENSEADSSRIPFGEGRPFWPNQG